MYTSKLQASADALSSAVNQADRTKALMQERRKRVADKSGDEFQAIYLICNKHRYASPILRSMSVEMSLRIILNNHNKGDSSKLIAGLIANGDTSKEYINKVFMKAFPEVVEDFGEIVDVRFHGIPEIDQWLEKTSDEAVESLFDSL